MLMLGFGITVIGHYWGWTPDTIGEVQTQSLMNVVQWGLGGFIAGRSVEKITDKVMSNPPRTRGDR